MILFVCIDCNQKVNILIIIIKPFKSYDNEYEQYDDEYEKYDYRSTNDRYSVNTFGRKNIPPSKNPTILINRILENYDNKIRPNDKQKPTNVSINIFVNSIDSIAETTMGKF